MAVLLLGVSPVAIAQKPTAGTAPLKAGTVPPLPPPPGPPGPPPVAAPSANASQVDGASNASATSALGGASASAASTLEPAAAAQKPAPARAGRGPAPPTPKEDLQINLDLIQAGYRGDADWARSLLAANADPNVQQAFGWGPMHSVMISCSGGQLQDPVPFVQVLLASRADINLKDQAGRTPLVFAAKTGRPEIVELFQGARELTDIKHSPVSALGRAMKDGHASVAEALLNMGHHHHRGDSLGVPVEHARKLMKDQKMDKVHHEARRLLTHEDNKAAKAAEL